MRDPKFSSPVFHSATRPISAEEINRKHVETFNTSRRRAGGPIAGATLLYGRRGPEVLLRGIAQRHTSSWYAIPLS